MLIREGISLLADLLVIGTFLFLLILVALDWDSRR